MKDGLWIPRGVLQRYSFAQALVGGALYEAYETNMGGRGDRIKLTMTELLENVGRVVTPETRAEVMEVLRSYHRTNRITFTVDADDVVTVWFTPEIQRRLKTYQEVARGKIQQEDSEAA